MALSPSSFINSISNTTAGRRTISLIQHRIKTLLRAPACRITAISASALAVLVSLWYWNRMAAISTKADDSALAQTSTSQPESHDAQSTDPELLRDNSEIKSFTTSRFTYPGVRVFYKAHAKLSELPTDPAPLPLLVFLHGLGGSVAQFHPLLKSLTHTSSCLAVDLPGCGVSEFAPTSWDAYSNEALVELLETIIESYRDKKAGQGVVLIGHSMGCALAAQLASPGSSELADFLVGLVAICPPSGPPPEVQSNTFRKLLWLPTPVFDLWRAWDARGGAESTSVRRFLGPDADIESKLSQFRFNRQSKTPVWRRMAWGSLAVYENGVPKGGIAGKAAWASLKVPVFLIGGGRDHITPAAEIDKIVGFLRSELPASEDGAAACQPIVDAAAPVDTTLEIPKPVETIGDIKDEDFHREKGAPNDEAHEDPTTPQERSVAIPPQPMHPQKVVKCIVLPRGTHAMLYTQDCSHILASKIADFLAQHVTGRLSRSWQLQYLNRDGKWDVKNLAKWKGVEPVSKNIAGVFRAMKTMREVDEEHTPVKFVERWGSIVKDVIDISKDEPVYDSTGLARGGVRYHKFPTVSKIPPTDDEVDKFIRLVDRLRKEQKTRAVEEGWNEDEEHVVCVHCHYGFNRTGYFIVCYLVERCGFGVQKAIDAFAEARPNGIKHSHFKDQLFVRYSDVTSQEA